MRRIRTNYPEKNNYAGGLLFRKKKRQKKRGMAGGRNLCRHSHHLLRTRRIPAVAAAKKKISLCSVPKPRLPTSARPLLSFSPSSSLFSLFPLTAHSFFFHFKQSLSLSLSGRSLLSGFSQSVCWHSRGEIPSSRSLPMPLLCGACEWTRKTQIQDRN